MYRNGSLSTFSVSSSSFDQFPILQPYTVGELFQSTNSLIKATHVNTYFDALFNVETYCLSVLGGTLISGSSSTLSTSSITFVATGEIHTLVLNTPASMGNDPFHNLGFSISHTVNYQPTLISGDTYSTQVYNGFSYDSSSDEGPIPYYYNIIQPQLYVTISPISGTLFSVQIINKKWFEQAVSIIGSQLTLNLLYLNMSSTDPIFPI